jgi:type IV secretory pathway VirB2 component (pilin)
MLKWLPLLALATAGLFLWFVVAFMSDNNRAWTTSEPVQILTGIGTLAGAVAMLAIVALGASRAFRRRGSTD